MEPLIKSRLVLLRPVALWGGILSWRREEPRTGSACIWCCDTKVLLRSAIYPLARSMGLGCRCQIDGGGSGGHGIDTGINGQGLQNRKQAVREYSSTEYYENDKILILGKTSCLYSCLAQGKGSITYAGIYSGICSQ